MEAMQRQRVNVSLRSMAANSQNAAVTRRGSPVGLQGMAPHPRLYESAGATWSPWAPAGETFWSKWRSLSLPELGRAVTGALADSPLEPGCHLPGLLRLHIGEANQQSLPYSVYRGVL